jgi:FHS family L-fucose permease-like MFS transporter
MASTFDYSGTKQGGISTATPVDGLIPGVLVLLVSFYFVIGIITVTNDLLISHLTGLFTLSVAKATYVQYTFFGAYVLMAIPSSRLIEKVGYKSSVISALILVAVGCMIFYPASILLSYELFLIGVFVMATGITLLQVVVNPYITRLGSERAAASRLNLAGGFNSMATVIGPLIGIQMMMSVNIPNADSTGVQLPYFFLALIVLSLAIVTKTFYFPNIDGDNSGTARGALKFRNLRLGTLAIFLYVGAEVAVGSFLLKYLMKDYVLGLSANDATSYVSIYWAGAMVGRILGFSFLHKITPSRALTYAGIGATILILIGVNSPPEIAVWALISIGLFNSIMWPCIFPLAIKDLGSYTNEGSGYMIIGVVGGAIVPMIQGIFADIISVEISFIVCGLCYGYIIFFGMSGHKSSAL